MKHRRLFLQLLSLAAVSPASATVICDFEKPSDLARWEWVTGGDSVVSIGSLSFGHADGNSFAQLNYDFTPPSEGAENYTPRYVQVKCNLSAVTGANAVAISFAVNAAQARLRLVDSTGQTFQHVINPSASLEYADANRLERTIIKFGATKSFWGGAADGVFHLPAKSLAVLAEGTGRRGKGWVRFDQVEVIDYEPEPVILENLQKHFVKRATELGSLSERLGVNVHFYKDDRAIDIIKNAGFRWIRMDLEWALAEKKRGIYDFSFFRKLVSDAESRGLRTLGILDYGNVLYTGDRLKPPTSPESIQAFALFSASAVAALKDTRTCFEIWNEPDLRTYWAGAPNPVQYGALVKATLQRIRARGLAPIILTAGLSAPNTETRAFWRQIASGGAQLGASGLGMHFYTQSAPETRWDDILELSATAARDLPGTKLWCTEWGYSSTLLDSAANGHSDAGRRKQATMTARMLLVGWLADLPLLNVYDLRDDGADAANKEHNYGLLAQDYSDKPAMKAVRTLTGLTTGRRLTGMINPVVMPQGMHAAKLEGPTDAVWIIWLDERALAKSIDVQLPVGYTQVTDTVGNDIEVSKSAESVTVQISVDSGPVYVHLPAVP